MKLRELLWVLDKRTVIWVAADPDRDAGVFLGEADHASHGGIAAKYLDCMVMKVYPEYYAAFARTGISVIIDKENRLED